MDKGLLWLTRGQLTLSVIAGGQPVLTVTTTGARTGQSRNPGWYHNMRAHPKVEVTYRNKTIEAIAREARDDERQAIWDQATAIYAGYQAYASRVRNREIHIMILSAGDLRQREPETTE